MISSVTIKSVALRAGVAVSTVSRVLNNKDRVSPKTREAVLKAIDDLGYVRNDLAASMKSKRKMFIVAIVPDLVNESYIAAVRGIEEIASLHGYYTLIYAANEGKHKNSGVLESRVMQIVDGVVLFPSTFDEAPHQDLGKPIVTIDRELPSNSGYSVTLDNFGGVCAMTQELIDYGHTKIAVIVGRSELNVTVDRIKGYVETLQKNNLEVRDEYICMGDWYQETGYRYTAKLLSMPDPPTAIFAFNNQICLGCAKYLMEHGFSIGRDISLVEFDDWMVAQYLGPGITSVSGSIDEMGRIGAEMLFALIEDRKESIVQKKAKVPVELIRRNSIARLH